MRRGETEVTREKLLRAGPCFSKVPRTFRGRKAIHWSTTCLFCKAVLFISCKRNKNKNNWKVSCLETPSFWRYRENYVKRQVSGLLRNRPQRREPTKSTHMWCRAWQPNPGHIGRRQVLSPLCHHCFPEYLHCSQEYFSVGFYQCNKCSESDLTESQKEHVNHEMKASDVHPNIQNGFFMGGSVLSGVDLPLIGVVFSLGACWPQLKQCVFFSSFKWDGSLSGCHAMLPPKSTIEMWLIKNDWNLSTETYLINVVYFICL